MRVLTQRWMVVVAALAIVAPVGAQDASLQEFRDSTETSARVRGAMDSLIRKQTLERFLKGNARNERWFADARQIIETWLEVAGTDELPHFPEMRVHSKAAQRLVRAGADDPIFRFVYADLLWHGRNGSMAMPIFRSLHTSAGVEDLPTWVHLRTVGWLLHQSTSEDERRLYASESFDLVRRLLSEEMATGHLEQAIFRYELLPLFQDRRIPISLREDAAHAFVRASEAGSVSKWLADMAMGSYHVAAAWDARGPGVARTVDDADWRRFRAHLDEATDYLLRAHAEHRDRPEAASQMIAVTMAGAGEMGGRNERGWFNEAVRAEFDFEDAYERLRWAYRPRWGGSHEMMLAFGRECAATERFDTVVPLQLIRVIEDIAGEEENFSILEDSDLWSEARDILLSYLDQDDPPLAPEFLHMRVVLYGWKAGDFALAKEHLPLVGESLTDAWLTLFGVTRQSLERDLLTRATSPERALQLSMGEGFMTTGEYAKAAEVFDALVSNLDQADSEFGAFVRRQRASARLMQSFADGEPTPLTWEDGEGWLVVEGRWSQDRDSILFHKGREGGVMLHGAPVGSRFELQGDVILRGDFFAEGGASVVFLATEPDDNGRKSGLALTLTPEKRPAIRLGRVQQGGRQLPGSLAYGVLRVRVVLFDDDMLVEINGEQVYRGVRPAFDDDESPGRLIGFEVPRSRNPIDVRFDRFMIRRLDARPEGLD